MNRTALRQAADAAIRATAAEISPANGGWAEQAVDGDRPSLQRAGVLDTASLSVQVMQDGTLSGDPLTVHPDGDAQAFLAGTAPLNDIGTLTTSATSGSTALLQARNSVGQPLFPVLTSLSGTDQVTASNGVASAISQAMLAGQGIRPGTRLDTALSLWVNLSR